MNQTSPSPSESARGLLNARWSGLTLARQFAIAGGAVMILSALLVGTWMADRIEDSTVRNSANATALYMESFLSPISQELARSDRLTPGAARALEEVFENTPLGKRVVSYKIWKPGGLIIASNNPELVGQRFPPTDNLKAAWNGEVRADFEDLSDLEDATEAALDLPLLEIYSPVREAWSGDTIAVAEFYEINTVLARDLAEARSNAWLAIGGLMLVIGGLLFGIVARGSRTIERQKQELRQQLSDLQAMSEHNTMLRMRVQGAAERASAMNEQALKRIGSDLHDGPAQHLALAALHVDALAESSDPASVRAEAATIGDAISEALREIRSISRGLLLPDIADRPLCDLVGGVVEAHARRSGAEVDFRCDVTTSGHVSEAVRICLYRFAQEGLSNAWRHAGGAGQSVTLTANDTQLTLVVADSGPGLPPPDQRGATGMGLAGLRDRVESLGGTFKAQQRSGGGTELRMELDLGGGRSK